MHKIYNSVKNNIGDIMRKKYTLFALLVLMTFSLLLIRYYTEGKTVKQNEEIKYTLIYQNDGVSLYHGERYVRSYDITVSALPLTDQDNLKSGIILENMDEVNRIIEDFDGN